MTTRFRAICVATIIMFFVFIGLSGVVNYQQIVFQAGVSNLVVADFLVSCFIALLLMLGTWWTLYFKRKNISLWVIGTFPAMAIMPYLMLSESIVNSIFSGFERITSAIIISALCWLITYLLLLTANILNGAILFGIPLGQAGKASQFIFTLISSYFLIVYLFSAAFPIETRVVMIGVFIFYYSFSTVWALQVSRRYAILSAGSITTLMIIVTLLLSIWPVPSVYSTLSAVVFLYIMLNVALEMREKVGKVIWIEYSVLILLVIVVLFTGGEWGINGTLL